MTERNRKARDPQLASLPALYFDTFNEDERAAHQAAIERLSVENPIELAHVTIGTAQHLSFTLITHDAPGLLSFMAGVMGARGFNIQHGRIFTTNDGIVIDSFQGSRDQNGDTAAGSSTAGGSDADGGSSTAGDERWARELTEELSRVLRPLRAAQPDPAEVRNEVMEIVARAHALNPRTDEPLLPLEMDVAQEDHATRVTVVSQDTPFFLYSLASALSLQDISIRALEIETVGERVTDTFWVQRAGGGRVDAPEDVARVKLSILVTKQFSHALDQAADPRGAFTRFEELVRRVAIEDGQSSLEQLLSDPHAQRELARLLGASDFLWEDFIRLQYENILPLLRNRRAREPMSTPSEELAERLRHALEAAPSHDEQKRTLNEFKNQESYLIDADHILQRDTDFFFLSHRLTRLAEVVVTEAFHIAWEALTETYGVPRSAAGLPGHYAVFGLGKMGGSALGYASDIELMTVYSDHGDTDGPRSLTNREFYERLVRTATDMIETRREAIFAIDLRLRPYGNDGPRAVHIQSLIDYFGPHGKAHSAERLALIRLRFVSGDVELGDRVIRIRDQLIYESDAIRVAEIRELRQRQAVEKAGDGRLNAKFSPGALVDLEYNVQLLQVAHGRRHPELRNPGIHASLRGLSELGTIDPEEAASMVRAYRFLRTLINGLRMLRGNAQDLFLPAFESVESAHLARRMGYRDTAELSAARQLHVDFEVETATVRSFVERHLGQDAIPELPAGNPADLVLSDSLSEERSSRVLASAGFRDPGRGIVNLRRMAGSGETRETFAHLIVLAWDYLSRSSDPDMALNNWDRFTAEVTDRPQFFRELLAQPRRMEIMLTIFAGSQFLSDTLIRTPVFLEWISDSNVVTAPRTETQMERELTEQLAGTADRMERLNILRRFRRREILRIGARDICLDGDFASVVAEISALARTVVRTALALAQEDHESVGRFCILAFGKLGGNELNYSSDIDLLALYEPDPTVEDQEQRASRLFRQVVRDVTDFTVEGQAYRVDLRLRPWGNAGRLVYARETLDRYYATEAELWELQALIKLAPIAGDIDAGWDFLEAVKPTFSRRLRNAGREEVLRTVRHLRARAVKQYEGAMPGVEDMGRSAQALAGVDVKNGEGGIRDIEFLVQALQMLHHDLYPQILTGNTLAALTRIEEASLMDGASVRQLRDDYLFMRRIEHFLQVYDDQQLHAIPTEPTAQQKMSRVVLGEPADPTRLLTQLGETLQRVHRTYLHVVAAHHAAP